MQADPSLPAIDAARARLGDRIVETPVFRWKGPAIDALVGRDTDLFLKLELFQVTGSFKPRGALTVMLDLEPEALARGVTTVSAGNHAIAVAYAARALGASARLVMAKGANPYRVAKARAFGAELVFADDVKQAFALAERLQAEEGRAFVHPFEGPLTALGTATLGRELLRQVPDLDAVVVPIGGGGLAAGVATAAKLIKPDCRVYGVEPEGADSMRRSVAAGAPVTLDRVATIADSLAPPMALPYSFDLCRRHVDEIVTLPDAALQAAMSLLFHQVRLAVEPAGAAATAAALAPLLPAIRGKRVGLIVCGANIAADDLARLIAGPA